MLARRFGDYASRIGKNSGGYPRGLEVMLYQAGDVRIVFNDEYSALHTRILAAGVPQNALGRAVIGLILC